MLAFIKKHYLGQRKLSSNLLDIIFALLVSWSFYISGVRANISLYSTLAFCCIPLIRASMALYCIVKFWGQKESERDKTY